MHERPSDAQVAQEPGLSGATWVIVLAAGTGQRMVAPMNKIFLPVGGKPVLARTLDAFESMPSIDGIVLVVAARDRPACEAMVDPGRYSKLRRIVVGGPTRHASEWLGLLALERDIESGAVGMVLVHDAVRPFVSAPEVDQLVAEAARSGAAILAIPAPDRIVVVEANGVVRDGGADLWIAQTPQAFQAPLLLEAHRRAAADGFVGADTSAVVERLGQTVSVVRGRPENIKITTSDDLLRAEIIVEALSDEGYTASLGTLTMSI